MPPADVSIELGTWRALRDAAAAIRFTVFVDEQKVPADIELDEWDERSLHAVARDAQGRALGTGRLLPDGHIGRMAVLKEARGLGVGSALLEALMQAARERGMQTVVLNAQTHAAPFYRRLGFAEEGAEFEEAGIPHVTMRARL
jgi:predicted GNAT family N-acyltransferase